MLVCPYDCHRCELAACPGEGCQMTGEPPLKECVVCGELVVRTVAFGMCIECSSVQLRGADGGH